MQRILLRILSGPMFGVDVALPDDSAHLFFCDSDSMEKQQSGSVYQHSLNTLLIPCAPGKNEKIILRQITSEEDADDIASPIKITAQRIPVEESQADCNIENDLADDDESESTNEDANEDANSDVLPLADDYSVITISLNQPVVIGNAVIALRLASDSWSSLVTQYDYPFSPYNEDIHSQIVLSSESEKKRPSILLSAACAAVCIAGAALLFVLCSPNEVVTLKDTLSLINPAISQNINGSIYVLTKTQPEAEWSEKALRKSNVARSNSVSILAETAEISRMKKILAEHLIPFFDIKFTSAFTVKLLLSQERSAKLQNIDQSIQKLLTFKFPYLKSINIQRVSDKTVLSNAIDRLRSLGVYSEKDISPNHVTLSISGEIDDFQLNTLRRQVDEFYDQYGDEYVKFVVNLNEDPLRNRTFKSGPDSYVVVPGNHWLYSDIVTTH
ncbi:hypothetical protein AC791_14430 [Klebsiella sp. RIT-PI-d]|uniref:PrgH/EprH family type III secretion apparatus protein n=1 Tax=Klebsiella sp. RIT-PI-d TaxID=1681196 RepID=UPI00067687D8|nr:PrgH/EprH family type III secretion apparatus protein [Klebsiella sp. RIT-PI-d]KNC09813.1 hypothetical protein AC791_14430 [Klebsiella sp. RIT-PI-d]